MKQIIDEIAAREQQKTEQLILKINADSFKAHSQMTQLLEMIKNSISPKELKKLQYGLADLKSEIDGNID